MTDPHAPAPSIQYACPMHPDVVRNGPGTCPRCGMALVPRPAGGPRPPLGASGGPLHGDGRDVGGRRDHDHDHGHGQAHADPARPGDAPATDMRVQAHRELLWPHYVNLMLGAWLVSAPFALGYLSELVPDPRILAVTADRNLPPLEWRNLGMTISDVVSGVLILLFSALSADANRRFPWAQWANATVGVWLLLAPLVLWTPLPVAYANATLVGTLVIALAVLIPMMPGMSMAGMMGPPDVPPGWAYTPSSWLQRAPVAVLALFGFLIARYLTAFQLGFIDHAWDPFFGGGTATIITSDVSKAWPVPDAGLGAVVYALELVMTFMGDRTRWRTMPWMVLGLGVLIVPLGVVSIYFIIIQPIVIGTWCTLCLVAAVAMAVMIPYSLDEFVAMGQFLADARRRGKSVWRVFWVGDAMEGGTADRAAGLVGGARQQWRESAQGVTLPWTLLASVAIGVWLTFSRVTAGAAGAQADSDHLVGALVVTFSIIACAEVGRAVRWLNVPLALWLIVSPWALAGGTLATAANSALSGAALLALAWPRGRIRESYASWDRWIL